MTTITPLLRVKERIVGPRGLWDIDNEWYGYSDEFKYTIGLAGLMGFGVGCCPPELLPSDMALLPGTEDRFSPTTAPTSTCPALRSSASCRPTTWTCRRWATRTRRSMAPRW
jgi:hypothetical protein